MFWNPDITLEDGPYKVLLKRGEFVDLVRNGREVPYKIYYPVDHGLEKMPVILWSHGFGGNRDGASFLSRYLASYGYVLVHMSHIGTDSSLWEGKDGHPWDILRQTKVSRETTFNRLYDVPFVLDQLKEWALDHPEIGDYMDLENVGMAGHSFGALSTQIAAGQLIPNSEGELTSIRDARIRAGILYSPVPIGHMVDDHHDGAVQSNIYQPIAIPLLHMTGTEDASPIGGAPYTHRFVVYDQTGHDEKYMLVKEDGDHMVYNGTRGKLEKNDKRGLHEDIIKLGSLAFWEAKLKHDSAAQSWLDHSLENWLGENGMFKKG